MATITNDGPGAAMDGETSELVRWQTSGAMLLLSLAAILGLYWQTAVETVAVWNESETFNHCFLILPICGYLVWQRWHSLRRQMPRPWLLGLVPLAGASVLWLISNTAGILIGEQVALVVMLQSAVVAVLGWRIAITLVFPLGFLFFAVPFGTSLIPFFQDVTAQLVVPMLRFTGIPVFIEGLYLEIPTGRFEVAEACSGVRYLISTFALGVLAANVLFETTWRRLIFVALSLLIPIIANGIRAYGIVMIAHLSDYEYAVGADHLIYGWIFFSFVTFCLLAVGMAMRARERAPQGDQAFAERQVDNMPRPKAPAIVTAGVAVLALASSGKLYQAYAMAPPEIEASLSTLTLDVSSSWGRAGGDPADWGDWQPKLAGATLQSRARFLAPDLYPVDLYVAQYAYQRQGAEAINESNWIFDPRAWRPLSQDQRRIRIGGVELDVHEIVLRSPAGEQRVLWRWYWVGGQYTINRYYGKLLEIRSKLLERSGEAALFAVLTDHDEEDGRSRARLQDFLDSLGPLEPSLAALADRQGR